MKIALYPEFGSINSQPVFGALYDTFNPRVKKQ